MGRLGKQPKKLKRIAAKKRWSEVDARVVLAAWRESGQSQEAFCKRIGIGTWRLWQWKKRLGATAGKPHPRFIPVSLVQSGAAGPSSSDVTVEIVLPRGLKVRTGAGFDPEKVAELVFALERGAC